MAKRLIPFNLTMRLNSSGILTTESAEVFTESYIAYLFKNKIIMRYVMVSLSNH